MKTQTEFNLRRMKILRQEIKSIALERKGLLKEWRVCKNELRELKEELKK